MPYEIKHEGRKEKSDSNYVLPIHWLVGNRDTYRGFCNFQGTDRDRSF